VCFVGVSKTHIFVEKQDTVKTHFMNKIRVILKCKSNKNTGYLRLSFRKDGKTILRSIGIESLEKRYFNPKEQRVRKSHPNHEELNNIIENKLDELKKKGTQLGVFNGDKKSFHSFFKSYLERIINQGTKLKYTNIYNLLTEYNTVVHKDVDIKFKDITIDYIEGFRKYQRETKKNSNNTVNYKLKSLNSILKKGVIECQYLYQVYPFQNIKLKFQNKKVEVLTPEEITRILNTPLKEVYRNKERFGQVITDKKVLNDLRYKHDNSLNDIRRYFIFQFLSQGVRSSDIITLRWNNFHVSGDEIRIKKNMIKTKHEIDILVNFSLIEILLVYLPQKWSDIYPKKHFHDIIQFMSTINEKRKLSGLFDGNNNIIEREQIDIVIENIDKSFEKYNLSIPSIWGLNLGVKKNKNNTFTTSLSKIDLLITNEINEIDDKLKKDLKYDVVVENYINYNNNKTDKLIYLENLRKYIENRIDEKLQKLDSDIDYYRMEVYKRFSDCIKIINQEKNLKNSFVFKFLKDSEFFDIDERNDFGLM
jgi:integrase